MAIGLSTVTAHFPDTVLTAEDFAYLAPITPAGMAGPQQLRRLRDPRATEILGEAAARRALDTAGLAAGDVDLLVTQHIGGQYILPGPGSGLHRALGLPRSTPAWNLQTSCASFVDGCELARNMVRAGEYRRVLLVTVTAVATPGWGVDQSSAFAQAAGDGAGAAVISDRDVRFEILAYSNRTYGELYDQMAVDFRPAEHPELIDERSPANTACGLHVQEEFFAWVQTEGGRGFARDCIGEALRKINFSFADLDLVIPHQAHKFMVDLWTEGLAEEGVAPDKWRDTWDRHGNIGAVDPAATLTEVLAQGELPAGAIVALFAPGAGGHTPTMILRYLG